VNEKWDKKLGPMPAGGGLRKTSVGVCRDIRSQARIAPFIRGKTHRVPATMHQTTPQARGQREGSFSSDKPVGGESGARLGQSLTYFKNKDHRASGNLKSEGRVRRSSSQLFPERGINLGGEIFKTYEFSERRMFEKICVGESSNLTKPLDPGGLDGKIQSQGLQT